MNKLSHPIPYISKPDEISNDVYHTGEQYKKFISSTYLKNYFISPNYARHIQLHPEGKPESEAMDEGSVWHDRLASIANHGDDKHHGWIVFDTPINPKTSKSFGYDTKAFQAAKWEALEGNPDAVGACSQALFDLVSNMLEVLLEGSSPLVKDITTLLRIGQAEQSQFLEYQGGLFKYRTDLKTKKKIVDWKKVRLGYPRVDQFERVIKDRQYDISAAMYQFLEFQLTGIWKPFLWVCQENEPPYDFNIIDSKNYTFDTTTDEIVMKPGGLAFMKLLEQHIICVERQEWPGYSVFTEPGFLGKRIAVAEMPGYYEKQLSFTYYNSKNE